MRVKTQSVRNQSKHWQRNPTWQRQFHRKGKRKKEYEINQEAKGNDTQLKKIRVGQRVSTGGKRTKEGNVKQDKTQEENTFKIKQEISTLSISCIFCNLKR